MEMYLYLKRLCNAIRSDRFNDKNYRQRRWWYGKQIETSPLFCSYGTIGFTASIYNENGCHECDVDYDWDMEQLTIDETPWKQYINSLYLEEHDINTISDDELETYTDAGEDMIISVEKVMKSELQKYIDEFDINEEVLKWWEGGKREAVEKGVPHDNIMEHYEDYESYLKWLQKVCDKMPF